MTAIAPRKLLRKKTEPTEEALPQGIVVGCKGGKHSTTAMIDTGDVHVLMIGAAGVGKTAFWLYPCIEYACASGMSFLSTDTKGDVMRNYGNIAKDYGYKVSVIDLRNPTRSNGNNISVSYTHLNTAVSAPVSPRVARYSPESGKHKPCECKEPFGTVFAPFCGNRQSVRK